MKQSFFHKLLTWFSRQFMLIIRDKFRASSRDYQHFLQVGFLAIFFINIAFYCSIAQDKTTVFVAMSDGVNLSTDIYKPDTKKAYPVILIRTPYRKEGMKMVAKYFVRNRFIVAVQDVRGKYSSQGSFIPFVNEKKDGKSTLDWLSQQKWCDGNIGMWGSSYMGYSALWLAALRHQNLRSIFNLSGWIDGTKVNSPGGALHQMLIIPWLMNEGLKTRIPTKEMDMDEIFQHVPLRDVLPDFRTKEGEIMNLADFQRTFPYQEVNIPIMHWTGWFDFVANATLDTYAAIRKHDQRKNKVQQQYLVLGPWYHNQWLHENPMLGDYKLKDNAQASIKGMLAVANTWFDHTLRGKQKKDKDDYVKYYVLFAEKWKTAQQWPPSNTSPNAFYLTNNQALRLKRSSKLSNSFSNFVYNPLEPVPTTDGANFHFFLDQMGIKKQNQLETRPDVLTFTTEAFVQDKIAAGHVSVLLYAETEGVGTDFTAKLTKVDKQGNSWNLIDGIMRVNPKYIKNKVAQVEIKLGNIAFQIKAGEKLRLQVSSSNFPKFNRNPNTGTHPLEATEFRAVKQTIHHSKTYPSQIIIPFLK